MKLYILASIVESVVQLGWHEQAIFYGEQASEIQQVPRVLHLMGKSFALLEDYQNSLVYLELAMSLGGENEELNDDLNYVFDCIQ